MKRTLRFLIPTLLLVAACGGDDSGDDTMGDDGPGVTCAMATATISAIPGMTTGTLKGAGADISAAEMSCAEEPFYTTPDGEDTVVELTGLTAGKHYGVTLTGADGDDLAFYVTNDCPMGGNVTACALYNDTSNAGSDEFNAFTATGSTAFVVVDYATEYNTDAAAFDGNFTLKVVEAACTPDTEATDCGAGTPICGDDFECHQCVSDSDCSGATPICGDDQVCKAGPALCVNDDANDGGNGDDAINNATMIAAPTANAPTMVTGRICSQDGAEVDWYKVTLASNVGISLTMDPTVDADLYLFDADGRSVDSSETDAKGATEYILTTDIDASATYYVVVHQYAPMASTATTPYTVRLNVPTCDPSQFISTTCTTAGSQVCSGAGECGPGPALCVSDDAGDNNGGDDSPTSARLLAASTSSSICNAPPTEVDWYKFVAVAGAGETVTLNWTGTTDLDLYVYNDKGTIYGASLYSQPEVVKLTQLPAGTYYVRVRNADTTATTAVQAYTIAGAVVAPAGCTTSTSCATEYKTQVFRGACATATGVCSFLPDGGAAGAACDGGANTCDDDNQCSYVFFQSNAQNAKCVSADGCTSDADCSGGFKCTKGFTINFLGMDFDVNYCKEACTTNTDCGANTDDDTLDATLPWNYNTCAPATGVCSFDGGA